jgi:hypothetical protein
MSMKLTRRRLLPWSEPVGHDAARHATAVAKAACQRPGIDALETRYSLFMEPLAKALLRGRVAVFPRKLGHNQCRDLNLPGFEVRRHTIVTHQRVREHEDLVAVGRIGKRFGVAHHPGVEYHLPARGTWKTVQPPGKQASVVQRECSTADGSCTRSQHGRPSGRRVNVPHRPALPLAGYGRPLRSRRH